MTPGGVGYDINCGVRLLRSKLKLDDVDDRDHIRLMVEAVTRADLSHNVARLRAFGVFEGEPNGATGQPPSTVAATC